MKQGICSYQRLRMTPSQRSTRKEGVQSYSHLEQKSANILNDLRNRFVDITLVNIHAPNIGVPKYIRKILVDFTKDIDSNTVTAGDFDTPLSTMCRSSKQGINNKIEALNDTLDRMDLIDIYRIFYPHRSKIHIISSIFSNHNGLKLETNLKEKIKHVQIHED